MINCTEECMNSANQAVEQMGDLPPFIILFVLMVTAMIILGMISVIIDDFKRSKSKKLYYSWDDMEIAVEALAKQIKKSGIKFKGVYGIPRGGLIFAVWLSHLLDLPLTNNPTKDMLIVDDISDKGDTLWKYRFHKMVCIFTTPWTKVKPTWSYYVKDDKEKWVIFPWECKLTEEKKNHTSLV